MSSEIDGMDLIAQVLSRRLKIWLAFAILLVLQGSAENEISPSPVTFDAISPIGEEIPANIPLWKQPRGNSPSPSTQPTVVSPPLKLDPVPVPETAKGLVPILSPHTPTLFPSNNSVPPSEIFQGIAPSLQPSSSQGTPPHINDTVLAPEASVPVVSPSRKTPQNPPSIHPVIPGSMPRSSPPSIQITPVQMAPPPREILEKPPTSQPIVTEVPPSNLPVPAASPPSNLPRFDFPPSIHPPLPRVPPSNLPVPTVLPPSILPRYSPPVQSIAPEVPPSNLPEPEVSPVSTTPPNFSKKRDEVPVAAPSGGKHLSPVDHSSEKTPVHNSPKDSENAPAPLTMIKSPPYAGIHPHTASPPTSFYRHHHEKRNAGSPSPASAGPFFAQPPSYPPDLDPKSGQKHHLRPGLNPGRPLSPVSPPQAKPSGQTKIPFPSPQISPSDSSMPHLPRVYALPPPPPNKDCTPLSCPEPFTNTLSGTSCGCVLPMQVGLRLSVALYTFFPLVSELATEIAAGVFVMQSQVRIMGANAASQDQEKTVVLVDLIPLGEKFDNVSAYVTYQRFWHKQVAISTTLFGDYEVLYVRYEGLPDAPPSSVTGEPYAGHDSNGRTIKPLGVDVRRRQHKEGFKGSVIAIIIVSASVAVILCSAVAWVLLFKRRDRNYQLDQTPPTKLHSLAKSSGAAASMTGSGPSSLSLSYNSAIAPYTGSAKTFTSSDMERATDNFATSRILGEGGFGLVYGGVLDDGTEVAVKVLKRDDQQGDREFLAEVEMLSRLHHRNLVKLIGICTEERARCLVYELIPNGSVESHLHGIDKEDSPLDWGARLKIALGAARGLAYLHEDSSPRVIHRDFKSSNILLEHDFTPKVSDFGLARSALDEENRHISTRVMGTFGYVAPEYAMTGHLLVKSDVYSYGVVLLELLTGRKPVDMSRPPGQENLVTWSRPLLTSKEGLELMTDQSLGPDFAFDSIAKVAAIASMCVQPEVSHRPFMGEVVQALKLVCNECDLTKDLGSRSCSQEDISVDFDARLSTNSGHLPDPLQMQSPLSDYESGLAVERGLPLSGMLSTSARIGRTDSESFRRHSSSGPLRSANLLPLWQRMRRLPGGSGSISEHGAMFRLLPGFH